MKKIFTPKVVFFMVLISLEIMAGICGFWLGKQDWTGGYVVGSIVVFLIILLIWEVAITVNEESVEKEDLIRAMQIYNCNVVEDPEGFNGIDKTRKCAEEQVDYLMEIIKYRIKN